MFYFKLLLIFAAVLRVSSKSPVISSITEDQVVSVGEAVEFNCTVENVEGYAVGWSKSTNDLGTGGGVVLSIRGVLSLSDPRYSIKEIKTDASSTYSFKIAKIEASDMGSYECQVIVSAIDKVTKSLKLSVKHPPIVSEEKTPKSVSVKEGENIEVTCYADGFPKPNLSWKREDNSIMPAGGTFHRGATLHIRKAHRLDRGGYYCIADNGVGVPNERIVRVEVEFRPQISVARPKVAQMKTHAAEMECSVQGYPPPLVFWFKDGTQLQSGGNYRITNMATAHETTNSVLRILSTNERDYGDYFCNATNKLGHADARLNLFQPVIPVPKV
ncbi:protein amalgam [Episyrphus balteatus]|uniref:protein amalgam n=1 Tax=Episyrphus balteatus TaxID=286459 RepID=UPI00248666E3|nr:protein amalgam [Episyrphus balteatus]